MSLNDSFHLLIENFIEKEDLLHNDSILWDVKPENTFNVAKALKNYGISHLNVIIALDTGNNLELRYVFNIKGFSKYNLQKGIMKVTLPFDDTIIPSIQSIYPVAVYHEREAFDMLGIQFEPKKRIHRILLPDPLPKDIFPLRKKY